MPENGLSVRSRFRGALIAVVSLFGAIPARAEPPIYVARGPRATVYFLGTFHELKPDFTWDQRRLVRVLDRLAEHSGEVWTELGDANDAASVRKATESLGHDVSRHLSDVISRQDFIALRDLLTNGGLPPEQIHMDTMRPWLAWATAAVVIMQRAGYRGAHGVESVVTSLARARRLPIHGFETASEQIRVLADLSDDTARTLLHGSLADPEGDVRRTDTLAAAWADGDEPSIARAVAEMRRESGETYGHLLTERNARWADRLGQQLGGSGDWLVAVGEGHLAGDDSVLAILRARGVTVTRLTGIEP